MELYERVRLLSEIKDVSLSKIAKYINVPQQTFHQWLRSGSQKNLWEHLPKLLEMFPDVRPEWLYMDQQPIVHDGAGGCLPQGYSSDEFELLKKKVVELEDECANLQRQLIENQAESLNDKRKIIDLLQCNRNNSAFPTETPAVGIPSAAPLSHRATDMKEGESL